MTIFKATSRLATTRGSLFQPLCRYSFSPLRVPTLGIIAILLFPAPGVTPALAATIKLDSDTQTSTGGYYQLHWQAAPPVPEFILYESTDDKYTNAVEIYRGADLATVISGKPDGRYYYRVTGPTGSDAVSNTVAVTVKHHPLPVAFSFFTVGAIVFLATLTLVLSGNRKAQ